MHLKKEEILQQNEANSLGLSLPLAGDYGLATVVTLP
jgi:hypothetical protein